MIVVVPTLPSADESENENDRGDGDDAEADRDVDGNLSRLEIILGGTQSFTRTELTRGDLSANKDALS